MKKQLYFICFIGLILVSPVMSQVIISANDLDAEQVTSFKVLGNVKIVARSDKNVTIESLDVPREAPDGELFNNRIKLNGSGTLDYRALVFTVSKKGNLIVYCNSSSKTDARILILVNTASGNVIGEITAEPDTGTKAGMVTIKLQDEGSYALYSKSGGINIYQLTVKEE